MRSLALLVLAGWTLFAADGAGQGRAGNDHYRAGRFGEAARAYEYGLAERDDPAARAPLTAALWTNLGLALHRADSTEKAMAAFQNAIATAPDSAALARAAYNAGTAAAQATHDEAALGHLRQALLADPTHADARFNFELVKRQLEREKKEQEKRDQQQPTPPDPSAFAEQLKARADSLVGRRRYGDAYRLMTQGLRRDSTVGAYRAFIQRAGDIAQIDTLSSTP